MKKRELLYLGGIGLLAGCVGGQDSGDDDASEDDTADDDSFPAPEDDEFPMEVGFAKRGSNDPFVHTRFDDPGYEDGSESCAVALERPLDEYLKQYEVPASVTIHPSREEGVRVFVTRVDLDYEVEDDEFEELREIVPSEAYLKVEESNSIICKCPVYAREPLPVHDV